ncbi:MAG: hypothetical protein OXI96_07865 [Acidimicrobiaceae bacterium]|nr:hypothetical protein [Acidimicrobiaceae bacterium]
MLILLPHTTIPRLAGWDSAMGLDEELSSSVTEFYGSRVWKHIHEKRSHQELTAAETRELYTELFRYRLENVLGYNRTLTIEMGNERGVPVYVLVFATDHDAGVRIMSSVFEQARKQAAEYRAEITERREREELTKAGIRPLFELPNETPRHFETTHTEGSPSIPDWLMEHIISDI